MRARTMREREEVWEVLDAIFEANPHQEITPGWLWHQARTSYSSIYPVLQDAMDAGILVRTGRGRYQFTDKCFRKM